MLSYSLLSTKFTENSDAPKQKENEMEKVFSDLEQSAKNGQKYQRNMSTNILNHIHYDLENSKHAILYTNKVTNVVETLFLTENDYKIFQAIKESRLSKDGENYKINSAKVETAVTFKDLNEIDPHAFLNKEKTEYTKHPRFLDENGTEIDVLKGTKNKFLLDVVGQSEVHKDNANFLLIDRLGKLESRHKVLSVEISKEKQDGFNMLYKTDGKGNILENKLYYKITTDKGENVNFVIPESVKQTERYYKKPGMTQAEYVQGLGNLRRPNLAKLNTLETLNTFGTAKIPQRSIVLTNRFAEKGQEVYFTKPKKTLGEEQIVTLKSNPQVSSGVSNSPFHYRAGKNQAVDVILTKMVKGEVYVAVLYDEKTGAAKFPGGMAEFQADGKINIKNIVSTAQNEALEENAITQEELEKCYIYAKQKEDKKWEFSNEPKKGFALQPITGKPVPYAEIPLNIKTFKKGGDNIGPLTFPAMFKHLKSKSIENLAQLKNLAVSNTAGKDCLGKEVTVADYRNGINSQNSSIGVVPKPRTPENETIWTEALRLGNLAKAWSQEKDSNNAKFNEIKQGFDFGESIEKNFNMGAESGKKLKYIPLNEVVKGFEKSPEFNHSGVLLAAKEQFQAAVKALKEQEASKNKNFNR